MYMLIIKKSSNSPLRNTQQFRYFRFQSVIFIFKSPPSIYNISFFLLIGQVKLAPSNITVFLCSLLTPINNININQQHLICFWNLWMGCDPHPARFIIWPKCFPLNHPQRKNVWVWYQSSNHFSPLFAKTQIFIGNLERSSYILRKSCNWSMYTTELPLLLPLVS